MTGIDKRVSLNLVGIDGNAFAVMGAFRRQAIDENWSEQEIAAVLTEAQSGNYDHLLLTIMNHCVDPTGEDGDR